jgi:hypothetical protein
MVDLVLRPSEPVKVTGAGEDRNVMDGQTVTLTGDNITISKLPREEIAATATPPASDDVFSPTNRPNGVMTAAIAPKMPKPMGELRHEVDERGHVVERPIAPRGVAEQAGGPDAKVASEAATPGPKPENAEARIDQVATGTHDVDAQGRPLARSEAAVSTGAEGRKQAAERDAKRNAPSKGGRKAKR